MNQAQLTRMQTGKGFVAALDQSGGSTPGALAQYGIDSTQYTTDAQMFQKIHEMRIRIITSPSFSADYILGAILFTGTMRLQIGGMATTQYLWQEKGIVPFLKVDQGMEDMRDGVRLMKPMTQLDDLLKEANAQGVFGTKMRSFIAESNREGIRQVVDQQFEYAARIAQAGLVPIVEPEVDIHSPDKQAAEAMLLEALQSALQNVPQEQKLLFKLSIPSVPDLYAPLMKYPQVVRVLALSGGYSRSEANKLLAQNHGLIASFSRTLVDGLSIHQSDEAFNKMLGETVRAIYDASIT